LNTDQRRAAYRFGLDAEAIAGAYLRLKGYRILARRFRAAGIEVDLVAERGPILALIEVKARATPEAGIAAITPQKHRRLARAGGMILARFGDGSASLRLDAVLIAPWRLPQHLEGVAEFMPD